VRRGAARLVRQQRRRRLALMTIDEFVTEFRRTGI
jgi:hypothetical protein